MIREAMGQLLLFSFAEMRKTFKIEVIRNKGKIEIMTVLNYESPKTLNSAIEALCASEGKARLLAGGTDLLVQMRLDHASPEIIIDIKKIPEMTKIIEKNGEIFIGAAVTGAMLNENEDIKLKWPGIVEALGLIGSTQIQGRATIGGNLCNGSPAADSVPAMIAADAMAIIQGKGGRREVLVNDFLVGPGKSVLRADEIVVSIKLPKRVSHASDAYLRFIPRTEMDIAVVGVGVNIATDESGCIKTARVALGAVAERAILVVDAANAILGTRLDEAALVRLSEATREACRPIDDKRGTKEFRIDVAGALAGRTAKISFERARVK